jgi:hypothetical protein
MAPGTISKQVGRLLALIGVLVPLLGVGASVPVASASPSSPIALTASKAAPPLAALSSDAAWAKALGPGVVVVPPERTAAGHSSPGAALLGLVGALDARQLKLWCSYYQPSFQTTCRADTGKIAPASMPTFKDLAPGYVVMDGKQALVGATGTACVPNEKPTCSTNRDPAAIFSTRRTFKALWAETVAAYNNPANVYSLDLCVKIGASWYNYEPPSK